MGWMIRGSSPGRAWEFSLHHCVQTSYGAHPAFYPRVPGALSLEVKRLGSEADYPPPSSAECVDLYLHSPNAPSWDCAQLKFESK